MFRLGDGRFERRTAAESVAAAIEDPACGMVNRNQGSGTRVLIDRLLGGARPPGYAVQATSHNAVAAAVAQGRADWGMAIESVAQANELGYLHYQDERYDFVVPDRRLAGAAVQEFIKLLAEEPTRQMLRELGFSVTESGRLSRPHEDFPPA